MRDLVISVVAVSLLLGIWCFFDAYSDKVLDDCVLIISGEVLPAAEESRWNDCSAAADELNTRWKKYRRTAMLFLGTEKINEIDYALAKSMKYIYARDISNSSGELDALMQQMIFLGSNEKLNWTNIL